MPNVTVVLVDDHELIRLGLRDFLTASARYEVVGEARTAREAFSVVASSQPDVVMMDVALPEMDGVVATREILRRVPRTRVLILSAHVQVNDVKDAMNAGALGYAVKGDEPQALIQALEHVCQGVRYLSPSLACRLTDVPRSCATGDVLDALSEREREIFRLAADCRTAAEISTQLCIARKTVDTHLNRINRKLGLRDRAELVRLALSIGLVHSIRRRSPRMAPPDEIAGEPAMAAVSEQLAVAAGRTGGGGRLGS